MPVPASLRTRWIPGVVLLVLGGLVVPSFLRWLFPSGIHGDVVFAGISWLVAGTWTAWGVLVLWLGPRPAVRKVSLAAAMLLVVVPVLGEIALRVASSIEGSPARHPKHFADYLSDDDYWKLHARWIGKWNPTSDRIHPLLGWSQEPITAANPLGLTPATRARLVRDGRRKILFYGDSFVAGESEPEDWIPSYLHRRIESADVLHLGVEGYGTDQIFLLFRETYGLVERPVVVFGVMIHDLDRAVLAGRPGRKPQLAPDGDALRVTGTPIPTDQTAYLLESPLELRSYFLSFVIRRVQLRLPLRFGRKIEQKKRINAAILDRMAALQRAEGFELSYVIFYGRPALLGADWQERFLKKELTERGIPYVDTRPALLAWCERTGAAVEDLYTPDGGHHNGTANRVIGDAIARRLARMGHR